MVKLPQHLNPTEEARIACAPYNFIPFPAVDVVAKAVKSAKDLPDHNTYGNPNYSHTGYFEVQLTTRSPLYIRCAFTRQMFEREAQEQDRNDRALNENTPYTDRVKNTPEFFYTRTATEPVIPGSSLRGMLRSLLEIVSYGKFTAVTDKNMIYRAVGDPSSLGAWYRDQTLGTNQATAPRMTFDYPVCKDNHLKGGYLCKHQGEWAIRPAIEHMGESFVHVDYRHTTTIGIGCAGQTVHRVYVQPAGRTTPRRSDPNLVLKMALTSRIATRTPDDKTVPTGMEPAVLVESGQMGRVGAPKAKHMHCAIYLEDTTARPIHIPQKIWKAFEEDRDLLRGIPTRKLTKEGEPLFYLLDSAGNLIFFGPTMLFRLPYERSIYKLIPEGLRSPENIDYAEALFGFVRQNSDFADKSIPPSGCKAKSYAGRVSVTDANLTDGQTNIWLAGNPDRAIPTSILSSPKPTTFQHYLVQPRTESNELSHFDSPKLDSRGKMRGEETVLRGHKLYWHQGDRTERNIRPEPRSPKADNQGNPERNSKLHTQFKPLKSGVSFRFKVYFENLSKIELGALCWILNPSGPDNIEYCHSLGMGKPLGMGAVKLNATLHLLQRKKRYEQLFSATNSWETGEEQQAKSGAEFWNQAVQEFEHDILAQIKPDRTCQHLYELKRVGMLLKMLAWPGFSPEPSTITNRVRTSNGQANTRYMTISLPNVEPRDKNEYKPRPVLPDPSWNGFGGISGMSIEQGEAGATTSPGTSNITTSLGVAKPSGSPTKPEPASTAVIPSPGSRLLKQIERLGGPPDTSLAQQYVERLEEITDAERTECIKMLWKWVQKNVKKEKHGEKAWYLRIKELGEAV